MILIYRIFFDLIAILSPKIKPPYIIILNYHSIFKNDTDITNEWSISIDMFYKQVKYLFENNIEIVALNNIDNINLKNNNSNKIYACITFDDGLEDNYNNAIPILKKFGITNATFFIVVNSLINKFDNAWWVRSNQKLKLMNNKQVINLRKFGYEVGSHALSHKNLNDVRNETLEKELAISKKILDNKYNFNCKSLAIPFSISGNKIKEKLVKNICRKNGYDFLFLGRFGYLNRKNYNKTDLPRIPIYRSDSMKTFILKVNGKYNFISKIYYLRKKIRYLFRI
jgi:peptidoglycan/xylan/chitin deacetylase (PgdA/CDA1 family)